MIEKIIKIKLPENLFSDDKAIRETVSEFDIKNSPNSYKIMGLNGANGLEEFDNFINKKFIFNT